MIDLSLEEAFEFGVVVSLVNDEIGSEDPIPSYLDERHYIVSVNRVPVEHPETFDHELIIYLNERVGGNYVDEFIRRPSGDWATESGAEVDGETLGYR